MRLLASRLDSPQKELAERVANSVDLVRAMSRLSRREREVVALHYRLDMSLSDIAKSLGIEEGTVKTLLHRARSHLLPLVEDRGPSRIDTDRRIG